MPEAPVLRTERQGKIIRNQFKRLEVRGQRIRVGLAKTQTKTLDIKSMVLLTREAVQRKYIQYLLI